MTAYILTFPAVDDVLLLAVVFIVMVMAIYTGKFTSHSRDLNRTSAESLITGATMGLSGVMTGLIFFISFTGYQLREQAQISEAQAVERALLYVGILPASVQGRAEILLKAYMNERIHFFQEDSIPAQRGWLILAEKKQWQLWQAVSSASLKQSAPFTASTLHVYSNLGQTLQQTSAVWRRQIPDPIWLIVIVTTMASCFLVGQQISEKHNYSHFLLLILPLLTATALFMAAEMDIPGQGIIHVMPDALERQEMLLTLKVGG